MLRWRTPPYAQVQVTPEEFPDSRAAKLPESPILRFSRADGADGAESRVPRQCPRFPEDLVVTRIDHAECRSVPNLPLGRVECGHYIQLT